MRPASRPQAPRPAGAPPRASHRTPHPAPPSSTHEPGPAARPVGHPDPARVQPYVLGDQREPEAAAGVLERAGPGRTPGRTARRSARGPPPARPGRHRPPPAGPPGRRGTPRPGPARGRAARRCRPGWTRPAPAGPGRRAPAPGRRPRRGTVGGPGHHVRGQLGQVQPLRRPERALVDAGDLEQVADQPAEPAQVGVEQVDRVPGGRRHLVPAPDQHLHRRAIVVTGERSSWLTSEANRASRATRACRSLGVSLNAAAIGPRSLSSRSGSRVDRSPCAIRAAAAVSSVSGAAPGGSPTSRSSAPSSPLASTPAEQHQADEPEGPVQVAQREHLDVRDLRRRAASSPPRPPGRRRPAAAAGRCRPGRPRRAVPVGMSPGSMLSVAVPPAIQPSGCRTKIAASGEEARPVSSAPRSADSLASRAVHQPRVDHRLPAHALLPLLEHVAGGEVPGRHRDHRRDRHRAERERRDHPVPDRHPGQRSHSSRPASR